MLQIALKPRLEQTFPTRPLHLSLFLFIIFIAFCVCWAPYIVVLLSDESDVFPLTVHLYASLFAHLHASVNFFIYGLTNNSLHAQ